MSLITRRWETQVEARFAFSLRVVSGPAVATPSGTCGGVTQHLHFSKPCWGLRCTCLCYSLSLLSDIVLQDHPKVWRRKTKQDKKGSREKKEEKGKDQLERRNRI